VLVHAPVELMLLSLTTALLPYDLHHKSFLPASLQFVCREKPLRNILSSYEQQDTPLQKIMSLKKRESNRGWARP